MVVIVANDPGAAAAGCSRRWTAIVPNERINREASTDALNWSARGRSRRNSSAIVAVRALPASSRMTLGGETSTPLGALDCGRPFLREHRSLLQHHAESCDTLFAHTAQELIHVRETPLQGFQQRRPDLRGQPFEIKALQDRTQMLVTARWQTVLQQIPGDNLQLARWNLLE